MAQDPLIQVLMAVWVLGSIAVLFAQGVHPKLVQQTLGNGQISLTLVT